MEEKITIYEKLSKIQNELKVPKSLFNKFGGYYYRNCESILESAKPICQKYRTTLVVRDDIEVIKDRYYVISIATLFDWDSAETISGKAMAREEESKKGMDSSQLTGSCSSYSRKYALNGLFNLDDVKDADSQDENMLVKRFLTLYTKTDIKAILEHYKVSDASQLTDDVLQQYIDFKEEKK